MSSGLNGTESLTATFFILLVRAPFKVVSALPFSKGSTFPFKAVSIFPFTIGTVALIAFEILSFPVFKRDSAFDFKTESFGMGRVFLSS
ncbi:hypothetical protein D3C87_1356910 [compost metagenome]